MPGWLKYRVGCRTARTFPEVDYFGCLTFRSWRVRPNSEYEITIGPEVIASNQKFSPDETMRVVDAYLKNSTPMASACLGGELVIQQPGRQGQGRCDSLREA